MRVARYLAVAAIYLAVDLAWIVFSKNAYEAAFGAPVTGSIPAAALAYAALILGFFVFVPTVARDAVAKRPGRPPWTVYAAVGAAFGACVYGVYNGTVAFQNANWRGAIIARDMAWGVSSSALMAVVLLAMTAKP